MSQLSLEIERTLARLIEAEKDSMSMGLMDAIAYAKSAARIHAYRDVIETHIPDALKKINST